MRERMWWVGAAMGLSMAACGGAGPGSASLQDGNPVIEREQEAGAEIPPHILVCGYYKVVDEPLDVTTYLDDPERGALSLYDFAHSESQMVTWMRDRPGTKAYGLRSTDGSQQNAIGRAVSEPCFGNGDLASGVIRQVVVHRAAGQNAREAMHNLLRKGRTTHFLIEADGRIYQPLDTVHSAITQSEHDQYAIYVGLVQPRRVFEWAPLVVADSGARGIVGALNTTKGETNGSAVSPPSDVQSPRGTCSLLGAEVSGELIPEAQRHALAGLLRTLADEYPELPLESPPAADGSELRGPLADALYHHGVMADFHIAGHEAEPACLSFADVLAP